jgi:hypothetical protein
MGVTLDVSNVFMHAIQIDLHRHLVFDMILEMAVFEKDLSVRIHTSTLALGLIFPEAKTIGGGNSLHHPGIIYRFF